MVRRHRRAAGGALFAFTWVSVFWVLGCIGCASGGAAGRGEGHRSRDAPGPGDHPLAPVPPSPGRRQPGLPRPSLRRAADRLLVGRSVLRRWFEARAVAAATRATCSLPAPAPSPRTFADRLESHPRWAYGDRPPSRPRSDQPTAAGVTRPILGTIDMLDAMFRERIVDEVGVCLPPTASHYLEPIVTSPRTRERRFACPVTPRKAC